MISALLGGGLAIAWVGPMRSPGPGEAFHAGLRFTGQRGVTRCGGLEIRWLGVETVRIPDPTSILGRAEVRTRTIVSVERTHGAFSVGEGDTLPISERFELPDDAPPSYSGNLSKIEYRVELVVLYAWREKRASFVVHVGTRPPRSFGARRAGRETSYSHGDADAPIVEASLSSEDVVLGVPAHGAYAVRNVARSKVESVEVALVTTETVLVPSPREPREAHRKTHVIPMPPAENLGETFGVVFPESCPASFRSELVDVAHRLEVRAVSPKAVTCVSIPVRVFRSIGSEEEQRANAQEFAVDRNALTWTRALGAALIGDAVITSNDVERRIATVESCGGTNTLCAKEGADGRVHLNAALGWKSLGIELSVMPLPGEPRAPSVHARFRERATGRESQQVDALFTSEVTDALAPCDGVLLSDTEGQCHEPKPALVYVELEQFLRNAMRLQNTMSNARARLPPPRAMREALDGYRAFATRHNADLTPGDLSIRVRHRGMDLTVAHEFRGADPLSSSLTTALPRGAFAATLGTPTLDFTESLSEDLGYAVAIERNELRVNMPVLMDPSGLDRMLGVLADAMERIARTQQSPYR